MPHTHTNSHVDSHTPDVVERLIVDQIRRTLLGNATSSQPHTTAHHDRRDLGDAGSGSRRHRRGRRHNIGMATMLRGAPAGVNGGFPGAPSFPPMVAPPPPMAPPMPSPPSGLKPMQTGCAWSVTVTAATYNVAFPDLNCVYQVLLFWGLSGKTALRIDGRFPRVRYFSFQSYDVASGQPLASIVDYEIEPRTGVNPFQEPPRVGEEGRDADATGTYHVHLTDTGDHGLQNELAATSAGANPRRRCRGKECLTLVIMRLYTADPNQDAFHGSHDVGQHKGHSREWGYVPAPAVSIRYGTQVNRRTGRTTARSKALVPCDPHKTTLAKSFLDWKVPQLQRDWEGTTPLDNEDDNFIVYTPASSSRALFANADASYLFGTARNNRTHEGKQLVARVTGHLPIVARGFGQYPRIADRDDYEARYVSLSTIALKGAGPVIDTVMDAAIEQRQLAKRRPQRWEGEDDDEDFEDEDDFEHHHHRHNHHPKHHHWKTHALDADPRGFSVVAAPSLDFLAGCPPQVYQGERDLFLTTVERGQRHPPAHLAFLYRQILSQWQTSGRQDRSIARAKYECQGRREEGLCHLRSFFVDLMGPQYPRIAFYYCWRNATRGCSCEHADGRPVLWEVEAPAEHEHEEEDDEEGWGHRHEFDDLFEGHPRHHRHRGHDHDESIGDDERDWDEWWGRSPSEMRGMESNGSLDAPAMEASNTTTTLNATAPLDAPAANATVPLASGSSTINDSNPVVHVNESALVKCHQPKGCVRGRPIIVPLHRIRVVDDVPKHHTRANISQATAVAATEAVAVASANATKEMSKAEGQEKEG